MWFVVVRAQPCLSTAISLNMFMLLSLCHLQLHGCCASWGSPAEVFSTAGGLCDKPATIFRSPSAAAVAMLLLL
jgi:hypothetical protein